MEKFELPMASFRLYNMPVTKSSFSRYFRKLIVGNQPEGDELTVTKMTILRGQFALVAITVGIIYATIVMVQGEFNFIPWHILLIGGSSLSFYLNRTGKHLSSSLLIVILGNVFVYLFSSVNRPQDGMFFFFFLTNTLTVVLLGHRYKGLTVLLILITVALAVLAYLFPTMIAPVPKNISPQIERTIFLINLVISLLFGSYVLVILIRANYETERKLLKQHEALTKINEELDRFVYSASHDMRAPLSSLLGLIAVTEKTQSPQEIAICLKMMRERIGVMEGFLKEITDYSRNVRTEVERKSIHVYNSIQASLNSLKFLFERDKIAVKVEVAAGLTLQTDEPRFNVVLNNLISNAIKYYDPQKPGPFIKISASIYKNQFVLTVKDNGVGISLEHQKRIFEMFYRATTQGEGSGLGLYIVRETVEKLGGAIEVQSTPATGSTFTVRLPVY
ncbi:MAG: HAMP domain-containing histidine kinase [Cyclobacteriaceae bacterium]|nr:HAMP domain-containing histidine kinase [Cyclobacteriaceae bacterium]